MTRDPQVAKEMFPANSPAKLKKRKPLHPDNPAKFRRESVVVAPGAANGDEVDYSCTHRKIANTEKTQTSRLYLSSRLGTPGTGDSFEDTCLAWGRLRIANLCWGNGNQPAWRGRELGVASPPAPMRTLGPTGATRAGHASHAPSHASQAVTATTRSPAASQRAPRGPRARRAKRGSRDSADRARLTCRLGPAAGS